MERLVNHIEMTIHPSQLRPILRALLFAIFFHRTLDAVEPETLELLESHISCAPNPSIQHEVNDKIEEFVQHYVDNENDCGEIAVVFLQKKSRKGWFAVTEAVPWEEHLITLKLSSTTKVSSPPLSNDQQNSNLSHQILIAPPSPADLFSPSSPPTHPMRLTSPPPAPFATPTTATALDITNPIQVTTESNNSAKRALSPTRATLGYFEQAKDGLKAVSAKAGAGVGWGGRAMGAAFGRSANGY
nr:hypothetical protein L203_02431 [Cryptococcus depauperatus CBS 7841]